MATAKVDVTSPACAFDYLPDVQRYDRSCESESHAKFALANPLRTLDSRLTCPHVSLKLIKLAFHSNLERPADLR